MLKEVKPDMKTQFHQRYQQRGRNYFLKNGNFGIEK